MDIFDLCDDFISSVIYDAPIEDVERCLSRISDYSKSQNGLEDQYVRLINCVAHLSERTEVIKLLSKNGLDIDNAIISDMFIPFGDCLQIRLISLLIRKTDTFLSEALLESYIKNPCQFYNPHNTNQDANQFNILYFLLKSRKFKYLEKFVKETDAFVTNNLVYVALLNKYEEEYSMLADYGYTINVDYLLKLIINHRNLVDEYVVPVWGNKLLMDESGDFLCFNNVDEIVAYLSSSETKEEFFSSLVNNYDHADVVQFLHRFDLTITALDINDFIYCFCIKYTECQDFFGEKLELNSRLDTLNIQNLLYVYNHEISNRITINCTQNACTDYLSHQDLTFLMTRFKISPEIDVFCDSGLVSAVLDSDDNDLIKLAIENNIINSANYNNVLEYTVEQKLYKALNALNLYYK